MSFLHGGSEAEDKAFSGNSFGGFFHKGVESIDFSIKKTYTVRLLPSFDYSINRNDSAFKESFISYRDANLKPDYNTKTPGFTSWYFIVSGYTFFGKSKKKFLSPLTGGPNNRPGVDPIRDCYDYIKKNRIESLQRLVVNDTSTKAAPYLSPARRFIISNALVANEDTGEPENKLIVYTEACLKDLKFKLSLRAGRGDPEISPEWPDYLYGDVTHPEQGSLAIVKEFKFDNFSTCAFFYSSKPQTLEGYKKYPLNINTPQGMAFLTNRYDISDTVNVTKIWTYEEILDLLLEDNIVPYDVIHAACSPYADVPEKPSYPKVMETYPGMTPDDDDSNSEGGTFTFTHDVAPQKASTTKMDVHSSTPAPAAVKETETPQMDVKQDESSDSDQSNDPEYKRFLELKDKILSGTAKNSEIVEYSKLSTKFSS